MKALAEMEAALEELERDLDAVRSREFRKMCRETIEEQRAMIKALRKFYN